MSLKEPVVLDDYDMQCVMDDAAQSGDREPQLRHRYVGRGMSPYHCVGMVGRFNLVELGHAIATTFPADVSLQLARAARVDSMGLDQIVYFPGFVTDEDEDWD